ncbi:MAG: class I SAM-dependent methyltransferase [Candidatus Bipolaricaulia bacterium]
MSKESPYADRASTYAKHRWPYPPEAVEFLVDRARITADSDVADVGAGTGALTEHLVDRARTVTAVEPDEAMRAHADRRLAVHPSYRGLPGTAEETELPPSSVDLVTVGQALHWFSPADALREFGRILRPNGRLAILWSTPAPSSIGSETARLLDRYGRLLRGRVPASVDELLPLYFDPALAEHSTFCWHVDEDWSRFIGGLSSSALAPSEKDPAYRPFCNDAREIFSRFSESGTLRIEIETHVVVGPLLP